jgi:hypothetical protein
MLVPTIISSVNWENVRVGKNKMQFFFKKMMALWSIFTIKVPFFDHKIQGFCFCYLPNTESKSNKFKQKIFNNSNYDNFHGGGDFSHVYVIMHKVHKF